MSALRLFAALVLCFVAIPAAAQIAPSGSQIVASADSPSHVIHVDVTLNGEGRVGYIVSRQGKPVIAESRLGFLFTDEVQYDEDDVAKLDDLLDLSDNALWDLIAGRAEPEPALAEFVARLRAL